MKIKFTVEITGELDGRMPTVGELAHFIEDRVLSRLILSEDCGAGEAFSIITEDAHVQKLEVVK